MKKTLRQRLYAYLKARPGVFISGGELERIASNATSYKPSTISRRLRELAEDGLIARNEEKRTVFYAYQPQKRTIREVVVREGRAVEVIREVIA